MEQDLERILITRDAIARRIEELGREVSTDLSALDDGAEVVLVAVLTGSIIFLADLIRQLPHKLRIDLVTVSSYPGRSVVSGGPVISGPLPDDLSGRHVLIVDDILDSGRTVRLLRSEIERRSPKSVRICVLLRKQTAAALRTPCDYVGFDIPDRFVVGYGLDYDDYYRNLPDIGILHPDAM